MTDKPDGKRRGWGKAPWIVVVLLLMYVLSIGPVFRVVGVPILVLKVYDPVFRAASVPGLRQALAWYLNAWAPGTMKVDSDPKSGISIYQLPAPP
jgi:hypothetical protein